ncbi:MAG: aspartate/glutamate racemase family protein [Thermoplasmata archaeon]|nr:aspartate/glutamate racemase family protein [Thermoplasmata archaeon]
MKILVINPVGTSVWDENDRKLYEGFTSPQTEVDVVSLDKGPGSIETREDEAEALPEIIKKAKELHKKYDGIVVNCCLDVGVDVIRSIIATPVIGPCEASLALASVLGRKIGIVSVSKTAIELFEELVIKYRMEERVVSIRGIDISVPEIEKDVEKTIELLKKEIEEAIKEQAQVIVLGCTGLAGFATKLQKFFKVPILDPAECAAKILENVVEIRKRF